MISWMDTSIIGFKCLIELRCWRIRYSLKRLEFSVDACVSKLQGYLPPLQITNLHCFSLSGCSLLFKTLFLVTNRSVEVGRVKLLTADGQCMHTDDVLIKITGGAGRRAHGGHYKHKTAFPTFYLLALSSNKRNMIQWNQIPENEHDNLCGAVPYKQMVPEKQ